MQVMISDYIDKKDDFCNLPYIEQVKYMAYFFVKITKDQIFTSKNIDKLYELAHINKPSNIADLFNKLKKKKVFILSNNGYVLHRNVFTSLEKEFSANKPKIKVSKTLRSLILKIEDQNKKSFLDEAIRCYEIDAHRSSIIMTWLLVIDHLYEYILINKLTEFNVALKKQYPKMESIKTKDDFTELKETHFIEICRSAKIITKDIRKILDEKLGVRNSCAHPNKVIISESKATSFIEDLIDNVMLKS